MKISNELYQAGILSSQETRKPTRYKVVPQSMTPRFGDGSPLFDAFQRREQSTKVTQRGWRVLSHVLRLH